MQKVIAAPQPLPARFDTPTVFLAGSISQGAAPDWQNEFVTSCAADAFCLLNPRRAVWPTEPTTLREQITWELQALERADVIALYLAPDSQSPISLLELGLWARSGKMIVACPDGFWRKENIVVTCERYHVPLVDDLSGLIHAVRERVSQLSSTIHHLHAGRFLRLVKEGRWEYADRTNATGACIILAVTDDQKLLLAEQYRIPVHARTIELPAGIIGDEPGSSDEAHADAARRELIEETGYDAGKIELLTHGPTSSGLTSETVTLFRASGLRRVGAGGGIAHEDITVHEVPLAEVHAWLETKTKAGLLVDPKIYAGLYFLKRAE